MDGGVRRQMGAGKPTGQVDEPVIAVALWDAVP